MKLFERNFWEWWFGHLLHWVFQKEFIVKLLLAFQGPFEDRCKQFEKRLALIPTICFFCYHFNSALASLLFTIQTHKSLEDKVIRDFRNILLAWNFFLRCCWCVAEKMKHQTIFAEHIHRIILTCQCCLYIGSFSNSPSFLKPYVGKLPDDIILFPRQWALADVWLGWKGIQRCPPSKMVSAQWQRALRRVAWGHGWCARGSRLLAQNISV